MPPDEARVLIGHPLDAPACTPDEAGLSEAFLLDVLAAVVDMALRSKRRQADLEAALRRAGLAPSRAHLLAAVERLSLRGYVENVVELYDGGVLLSVTVLGLEHLGRMRPRPR